jgi:resuscitation-promoting factor RpfB
MRKPILIAFAVMLALLSLAACGGTPPASPSPGATSTTAAPTPSARSTTPQPKIEKKTTTETQAIPFRKRTVKDPSLDKGRTVIRTRGVNGVKTLTYEVTFTDGVQTDKRLLSEVVTIPPTTHVTAVGTKVQATPARQCDPNYSGACVPIASDVDCEGGSGNGPAYVRGPVRVIGSDIYDLDRDGDGIGCD